MTVFEALDDAGLVTAAVNFTCYRGPDRAPATLPGLTRAARGPAAVLLLQPLRVGRDRRAARGPPPLGRDDRRLRRRGRPLARHPRRLRLPRLLPLRLRLRLARARARGRGRASSPTPTGRSRAARRGRRAGRVPRALRGGRSAPTTGRRRSRRRCRSRRRSPTCGSSGARPRPSARSRSAPRTAPARSTGCRAAAEPVRELAERLDGAAGGRRRALPRGRRRGRPARRRGAPLPASGGGLGARRRRGGARPPGRARRGSGRRCTTRTPATCSSRPPTASSSPTSAVAHHAGGGSHGSLLAGDSEVPMLGVGVDAVPPGITDVMPAVLAHFGVEPPAYARPPVPPDACSATRAAHGRASSCAGAGSPTSASWRRWSACRASSSCPSGVATAPTTTRRCRSATARRSRSRTWSRASARRSCCAATSACSTSAPAPATRRPSSPSSPPRCTRSSGSPSSPSARREALAAAGYERVHVHVGDGTLGAPRARAVRRDRRGRRRAGPSARRSTTQLEPNGRLVVPVGGRGAASGSSSSCAARRVRRCSARCPCRFVPLVGARASTVTGRSGRLSWYRSRPWRAPRQRAIAATRARSALRRPHNWIQLLKFSVVGAAGTSSTSPSTSRSCAAPACTTCPAAACSFVVAVTNNYLWNRLWTFRGQRGHVAYQGMRFLVVSVVALGAQPRRCCTSSSGSGWTRSSRRRSRSCS